MNCLPKNASRIISNRWQSCSFGHWCILLASHCYEEVVAPLAFCMCGKKFPSCSHLTRSVDLVPENRAEERLFAKAVSNALGRKWLRLSRCLMPIFLKESITLAHFARLAVATNGSQDKMARCFCCGLLTAGPQNLRNIRGLAKFATVPLPILYLRVAVASAPN